jgi:hypothetical protein
LDIKFTGSGVFLYNPFFNTLIPPSAGIVAFDENKQYRGNLLASSFGSSRRPGPADWITLSNLCYLGRIMSLPLPVGSDPKKGLTPGKYYLQVIYHRRFISSPPVDERVGRITPESLKNWYDKFPETDLFRSNIVEIEIVE